MVFIWPLCGLFVQAQHGLNSTTMHTSVVHHACCRYSLPDSPSDGNFGIAHTGFVDSAKECRPVRVQTSVGAEKPEINDKSEERPAASPLALNVTVSNLTAGEAYTLYVYDDEGKVPASGFHAHAAAAFAVRNFTATGDVWSMQEDVVSSDKRFYRCVAAASAAAAAANTTTAAAAGANVDANAHSGRRTYVLVYLVPWYVLCYFY